jgi:hypothetical protein
MFSTRLPLIIDNQPIRKDLFKTAAEVLKKIEKLEKELANFHDKDQSLYQNWYQLTFQDDLKRADKLYDEYNRLAKLHNSVLAQADMYDQSHGEALATLRREQKKYDKGTEAEKKKIDEKRLRREEFLKENSDNQINFDDEEMTEAPNRRKESFYFFEFILTAIEQREGLRILSLWDQATPELRQDAEESFQELQGVSLTAFIEMLREERARVDEDLKSSVNPELPPTQPNRLDAKFLYRKLARRLHPDVMKATTKVTAAWVLQTWLKVQEAYQRDDAEALERLDLITLIRMEDLHRISLDELRASGDALKKEFQDMTSSVRDLKKHPAWKFSTKRSFDTLKNKIRQKLRRDLDPIKFDIETLREMYGRR